MGEVCWNEETVNSFPSFLPTVHGHSSRGNLPDPYTDHQRRTFPIADTQSLPWSFPTLLSRLPLALDRRISVFPSELQHRECLWTIWFLDHCAMFCIGHALGCHWEGSQIIHRRILQWPESQSRVTELNCNAPFLRCKARWTTRLKCSTFPRLYLPQSQD